jgi:thiosulfate reductase / polysulfide reductase chain A
VNRIESNPRVPGMEGSACPGGAARLALLNDPERLQSLMIRTGQSGSGKWRKAT